MTAKEKARELVNLYYGCSHSQLEAIAKVDQVLLTKFCQDVDSLHSHVFFRNDFDDALIKSSIQQLKFWQEVAYEVSIIKNKIPVS